MSDLPTSTIAIRALICWVAGIILWAVFSFNNEAREKTGPIWPILVQVLVARTLSLLGPAGLGLVVFREFKDLPLWQRELTIGLTLAAGVWITGLVMLSMQNVGRRTLGLRPYPYGVWPFAKRRRK